MAKRKATSYTLLNDKAKPVCLNETLDMVTRYLKHCCPDGIFAIRGPDTDCTFERKDGIMYPTSGVLQGRRIKPKSLAEAEEFFREKREQLEREQAERKQRNYAVIGLTDCVYAVDLRAWPEEHVRNSRKRFRDYSDTPKIRLPKRFFTWEEARRVAVHFNEAVLRRPSPNGDEDRWQDYLENTVLEMIVALENAEGPNDPEYIDAIEQHGLI